MKRYLIVANQTLGGRHLLDEIRERTERGPCAFHVVVPATPAHDQWVHTEGEAQAIAEGRLETALERFGQLGVEVTGEVGDERPLDAIRDALLDEIYHGIVLSTLPAGISRWIGMDLPHQVERAFSLPVTHVIAEAEPADSPG